MSMMIQEFVGDAFHHTVKNNETPLSLTETSVVDAVDPNSLMVEIEAIHAYPYATRNYTRYMPNCLKNSVSSWLQPYKKPLIKHHNDANGEIIGRVMDATYKESGTLTGTPALVLTVNIPNEDTKKDVKSGLLCSTSIGAIARDVRCSICGTHLISGNECEHERGAVYDGETCYWDIYDMEAKEISYVVVPSDSYSKNINYYPAERSGTMRHVTEKLDETITSGGDNMEKELETIQAELAEATEKVSELEGKNSELDAENAKLREAIDKANEEIATLKASLETAEAEKTTLTQTLENETKVREALEDEMTVTKGQLKASMIETVQSIREALGKTKLEDTKLQERSDDSLRDSIEDLKEELSAQLASKQIDVSEKNTIQRVQDPTLANSDEKNDLKESLKKHNLTQDFQSIFTDIINVHNK